MADVSAPIVCRLLAEAGVRLHSARMPRPPRVEVPGATFHVFSRGVRKQPIFVDEQDCRGFLDLLALVVRRFGWLTLAYCLMENHFHLLVETPEPTLSAGMHRLKGDHAEWFNTRHGFEGHVFERRFGSVLAQTDPHLLELLRYVVLNPVRAGICDDPADWPWSSYRATRGLEPPEPFMRVERALSLLESGSGDAAAAYEDFVALGAELPTAE